VDVGMVLLHAAHQLHRVLIGWGGLLLQERFDVEVAHLELVTESQGPLPSLAAASRDGHRAQARARDSPVRGSTLIVAPGSTKSGTCTTSPVSSVAGFRAPDTRSPCTPGSVTDTVSSTAAGSSAATTAPSYMCRMALSPSFRKSTALPRSAVATLSW